jgi:hypothetical protein
VGRTSGAEKSRSSAREEFFQQCRPLADVTPLDFDVHLPVQELHGIQGITIPRRHELSARDVKRLSIYALGPASQAFRQAFVHPSLRTILLFVG